MTESGLNDREAIRSIVAALAERLAASMGLELVLLEIKGTGKSVVRAFIDRPGGVTLDDCERFSKRFSVSLDVEDWIPFSYILEVSSPGVNRPLIKEADFRRFCGRDVKVRTKIPLKGQRNFKGRIAGVTEGRMELEIAPGEKIEIALMDIEKASLIADLSMRPKGS